MLLLPAPLQAPTVPEFQNFKLLQIPTAAVSGVALRRQSPQIFHIHPNRSLQSAMTSSQLVNTPRRANESCENSSSAQLQSSHRDRAFEDNSDTMDKSRTGCRVLSCKVDRLSGPCSHYVSKVQARDKRRVRSSDALLGSPMHFSSLIRDSGLSCQFSGYSPVLGALGVPAYVGIEQFWTWS